MNCLVAQVVIFSKIVGFVYIEIIPVEFVQPVPSAEPHITRIVLGDAIDGIYRKPLFNLDVFGSDFVKAEIIFLSKRLDTYKTCDKKCNKEINIPFVRRKNHYILIY
jgi:hypothetical protein